ncbi:hypothetical protein SADUNF_Sadunf08G0003000 [Salix dunnii]|uniref:Uncharacterized protein n=1 Tax=Salix dunnii TaxID=1413687 RepID=A0A835MRQ2_9ROSI|nr:hypothetical protein SADUNF_Sadunf08G0003000 [Salix dunnii]
MHNFNIENFILDPVVQHYQLCYPQNYWQRWKWNIIPRASSCCRGFRTQIEKLKQPVSFALVKAQRLFRLWISWVRLPGAVLAVYLCNVFH